MEKIKSDLWATAERRLESRAMKDLKVILDHAVIDLARTGEEPDTESAFKALHAHLGAFPGDLADLYPHVTGYRFWQSDVWELSEDEKSQIRTNVARNWTLVDYLVDLATAMIEATK